MSDRTIAEAKARALARMKATLRLMPRILHWALWLALAVFVLGMTARHIVTIFTLGWEWAK